MEYQSAQEAAERWGCTVRWVQQCCKDGLIPGAGKLGRSWMIPADAPKPDPASELDPEADSALAVSREMVLMPLMNSSFPPGGCRAYIEAIGSEDEQTMAWAQYYYFKGQAEEASDLLEVYLNHEDLALRLTAGILYSFSNFTLGHIHSARFGLDCVRETVFKGMKADEETRAMCICALTVASVLLHLPVPEIPPLLGQLKYLPGGLQLFASYVLAHEAYLHGEYERSLGIAETALSIQREPYPIPTVYAHLVAAMDLMSLKRTEEARQHFLAGWGIAKADDFIQAFVEHHGLVQGLVETCLKEDFPEDYERIIDTTYRFSAGWRQIHNPDTREEVADNLTTTEFTIAMLANRGWSNKEIAAHMKFSEHTVKRYISIIYQKLDISSRSQLSRYMLR